jgi:hypothetical protein
MPRSICEEESSRSLGTLGTLPIENACYDGHDSSELAVRPLAEVVFAHERPEKARA